MEGLNNLKTNQEKSYEPFLEELWGEYDFAGRPPFAGSVAEAKLKEACDKYANFIDGHKGLPGDEARIYGNRKIESSNSDRRVLHNQVALMVMGKQRSGMDLETAMIITEFAYEYSRGYKIKEAEKFKNQNGETM